MSPKCLKHGWENHTDAPCPWCRIAELRTQLAAAQARCEKLEAWADELRDRIRDIHLNTTREMMNHADVAGEEIASAEKECRIRHEAIVRPRCEEPTPTAGRERGEES